MSHIRREVRKALVAHRNRKALKDHSELLEPGLWVFSAWELWVKAGHRVPPNLVHSKGNGRGPLAYRLAKAALSPLYWVIVPRKNARPGGYVAMVKGPTIRREPFFFRHRSVAGP